ncbi:MAG: 6,7-dimethyl-8-ribityllumazine synthase, partial [Tissierellales bacterium]|nr:6,7-dimethyl-8-ribityllumazine synthase [Tissierellales bacterium]
MNVYEGNLIASEGKYAIIVGRFNEFIGGKLLDGAIDALKRHGVDENDISLIWVPGAFE